MSKMLPAQSDALPLREVLRGLRHIARRGGEAARDLTAAIASADADRNIVNRLAVTVISEMEHIAVSLDGAAARAARGALGGLGEVTATLPELHDGCESSRPLAAALYTTLCMALSRLGAEHLFVSEMAARDAVLRWQRLSGAVADSRLAVGLALALAEQHTVRGNPAHGTARVTATNSCRW